MAGDLSVHLVTIMGCEAARFVPISSTKRPTDYERKAQKIFRFFGP